MFKTSLGYSSQTPSQPSPTILPNYVTSKERPEATGVLLDISHALYRSGASPGWLAHCPCDVDVGGPCLEAAGLKQ